MNVADLRYLWNRDEAGFLERPSIHRIDPEGPYSVDNCEYIELGDNIRLARKRSNRVGWTPERRAQYNESIKCKRLAESSFDRSGIPGAAEGRAGKLSEVDE